MSPLSKDQWKSVARAMLFSFVSTFLAVVVAAGGIQSTYEANIALVGSALVSGINAVLFAVSKLFVEDGKN